jgi:hypothetical protein
MVTFISVWSFSILAILVARCAFYDVKNSMILWSSVNPVWAEVKPYRTPLKASLRLKVGWSSVIKN